MPSPGRLLLQARRVHYAYPDGIRALRGASFSVRRGELWALVGPNGSGKTTLALHLNGTLLPQRGDVMVDGVSTSAVPRGGLAGKVAVCTQNPDHQLFSPTVEEEVAFAPRALGFPPHRREQVVEWALRAVGVAGLRRHNPFALSLGQRHLVAMAAALAQDTDTLVLDEPTRGLDRSARDRLAGVLKALAKRGRGVVVATHDLDWAWAHAQQVALVDRGRVAAAGDAGLLSSEAARRLGCAPPLALLGRAARSAGAARTPQALAETIAAGRQGGRGGGRGERG